LTKAINYHIFAYMKEQPETHGFLAFSS